MNDAKLLSRLEAPPGFEPGVEVLQTSALPLGDGAVGTLRGETGHLTSTRSGIGLRVLRSAAREVDEALSHKARGAEWASGPHGAERAERGEGPPRVLMERETGFEPATSTLARSHSTTELFPPAPNR